MPSRRDAASSKHIVTTCFIKLSGIDKALAALTKAHNMINEMISLI